MSNIGIEINPEVVEKWKKLQPTGFELVHNDAFNYLINYRFTGKELVYCDPPYLREIRKKCERLYKYDYGREQHIELLEVLKSLSCMVMISGYESTLYKESLMGWHTHSFQAACHHGVATEWLCMNYSAPVELHDYRYPGNTFRERERIKRICKLDGETSIHACFRAPGVEGITLAAALLKALINSLAIQGLKDQELGGISNTLITYSRSDARNITGLTIKL